MQDERIALCNSADLREGSLAVPFDVVFAGQTCRAFAVRYGAAVHAYVNRCSHVAMELDWQPAYAPDTGACVGGPCRKALQKIDCSEADNIVYWHSAWNIKPVFF